MGTGDASAPLPVAAPCLRCRGGNLALIIHASQGDRRIAVMPPILILAALDRGMDQVRGTDLAEMIEDRLKVVLRVLGNRELAVNALGVRVDHGLVERHT